MIPKLFTSKRRARVEAHDLDMVPMMNLFTVLVPVLLLAAVFAKVTVLDIELPPKASGEAGAAAYEEKGELTLVVVIGEEGITVGGTGGFLPSILRENGEYRPEELSALLQSVRDEYPDETKVTVAADRAVAYEDVIEVMDICRDRGFTGIALSALHSTPAVARGDG